MQPATNKAARLRQVEDLLLKNPDGLTPAAIARQLGVNRSTVGRYLPDLPDCVYISEDGKWRIDRHAYLVNVRFSLHEALELLMAARLLAANTDRQNEHAAAALRKLGLALERLAPQIGRHISQSAEGMVSPSRRSDPAYIQALERLAIAWAEGRKTRVFHRSVRSGNISEYIFSPYFIEPYAAGQSTHAIGLREPPGALRTFKIERIERVELLKETYSLPEDFDPRRLLEDAWGVWFTEAEPVEVRLRFSPQSAARLRETRWHASERLEELPGGWLLWCARVAEPQEMLPWIRGWGAGVEVLAPAWLREALATEARALAELYRVRD
jgi:predicted DNA-binding transcriptional regulator YafY